MSNPAGGIVHTETLIYSAAPQFAADAPYQIAIVELEDGGRLTVRIDGERASIGDRVAFAEFRDRVPFYRKSA